MFSSGMGDHTLCSGFIKWDFRGDRITHSGTYVNPFGPGPARPVSSRPVLSGVYIYYKYFIIQHYEILLIHMYVLYTEFILVWCDYKMYCIVFVWRETPL